MTDIIRQLYTGEIYPDDEIIPRDKEYQSKMKKIYQERDYLKSALSPEDYNHLEQMEQLRSDVSLMNYYANFSYGFRLGVQLMSEVCGRVDDTYTRED